MDEYLDKVSKIAWVMYEINGDVIEEYLPFIKQCYNNNFTPRRTVETLANDLFG